MRKLLLTLSLLALAAAPARAQLSDGEILDNVQHAAFNYFWNEANPTLGLIKDRSTAGSPCSIASVGFGLSAICVGVDHGWVTRDDARTRVYHTLHTFYTWPQGTATSGTIGYRGFFYHFLDMNTGFRMPGWNPELSTIDSALLMAGILDAGAYFNDGSDTTEAAIRTMADSLYDRMDWTFFRNGTTRIYMGWQPGGGGFGGFGQWVGYNEAMIMEIEALGSSTYVVPTSLWAGWTGGYSFGNQYGYNYVIFPPLFGHQYSHCWIDFRGIQDAYMQGKGMTYALNTRYATLAQQAYCIANPAGWPGYSDSLWGITAGDDRYSGYTARGAPPPQTDNGTISPTAACGSLPFVPEACMPAIRNMYNNYPLLWGTYGFLDAFNLRAPAWYDTDFLGIDQGPIVLMIENYTGNNIWNRFMQIPQIQNGLARAGFVPVGAITAAPPPLPSVGVALLASEPSPITGRGTIRFRQPAAGRVRLVLYDARGRKERVLIDDERPAGDQAVALDTRGLAQGVYLARLDTVSGSALQKYVVLDR
jgi:hypothetical protein